MPVVVGWRIPVIVATLEDSGSCDGSGRPGRPGRPPLAAKREQFGRLIGRGVGNAVACRIVGVHPKTGKRWRRGRVVTSSSGARLQYAAVVDTRKQVISGRFLSEDERVRIADLLGARFGGGAIAAPLRRAPHLRTRGSDARERGHRERPSRRRDRLRRCRYRRSVSGPDRGVMLLPDHVRPAYQMIGAPSVSASRVAADPARFTAQLPKACRG